VIDSLAIRARFEALAPFLNERARRLFAATEARLAGRGGVSAVSAATGVARSTIGRGLAELRREESPPSDRVRRPGGGRKQKVDTEPGLLDALSKLVESAIRGDPEAPLLWVSKSQRHLAAALAEQGFTASQKLVGRLLRRLGFSLQANRKISEGTSHPDRNAQFEHINMLVNAFQAAGQPAISVDTKKKELVGDFKNNGRELRPRGHPEPVRVHDFAIPELGKVSPYGVYDIAANTGWINLGITSDTAAFAVESIRRWWFELGQARYKRARKILITADCGGSNGARVRLWKSELQKLADQTRLSITVAHLPPGTSSRVDDWRGSGRSRGVAVSGGFRHVPVPYFPWTVAPFPVAARQTGRADFPHPAFSCLIRPSHSAGRSDVVASCKGRACCRDTRSGIGDTRCLLVHCVEPTSVADAVAHTSAPTCRSAEPAPG
jgi:transposase